MNGIEIKLQVKSYDQCGYSDAYGSEFQAVNAVLECLESGPKTVYVTPEVRLEEVEQTLVKHFTSKYGDSAIEVRSGVRGGCYGSRDGSVHEGLTLYIDALEFSERFTDDDGDEIVNIHILFEEYGEEVKIKDVEAMIDAFEHLGIEAKFDNTYNYLGHDENSVFALQTVDYEIYDNSEGGGSCLVVAKFHGGGDVRGNYSSKYVYKFEHLEDALNVLHPEPILKNGEAS